MHPSLTTWFLDIRMYRTCRHTLRSLEFAVSNDTVVSADDTDIVLLTHHWKEDFHRDTYFSTAIKEKNKNKKNSEELECKIVIRDSIRIT